MIHQGVGEVVDHQLRTPLSRTTSCAVSANDLRGADFKAFAGSGFQSVRRNGHFLETYIRMFK